MISNLTTNQKVWQNGTELDNWACDTNPQTGEYETNGGVEHLIEYKGQTYPIITDWEEETILNPNQQAKPYHQTPEDDNKIQAHYAT